MAILERPKETGLTGNLFLDTLSTEVIAALLPQLEHIAMPLRFRCSEQGLPVAWVRFPLESVVSIIARMREGGSHEIGLIGREGAVGALEVLFDGPSLYESFVQIPDSALAIKASDFANTMTEYPDLRSALLRYAHAFQGSISQSAACNGGHHVDERCAKWLLIAHDRVPSDQIDLTHEFLAQMLNVRRSGVTNACAYLQEMGAIKYARAKITVVERSILERLTCECYQIMNDNAALVLGYDIRKRTHNN